MWNIFLSSLMQKQVVIEDGLQRELLWRMNFPADGLFLPFTIFQPPYYVGASPSALKLGHRQPRQVLKGYVDVTEGEEEKEFEGQFVLSGLVFRGFCRGPRQG